MIHSKVNGWLIKSGLNFSGRLEYWVSHPDEGIWLYRDSIAACIKFAKKSCPLVTRSNGRDIVNRRRPVNYMSY